MTAGMRRAPQENRAEVIFRWTALMQRGTQCSDETIGIRIVDWYQANLPDCARTLDFKIKGDPFRCAKTNAQRLMRYRKQDINTRMPVEIEEAWVMAGLIEPYRTNCMCELAKRYGSLYVPLPSANGVTDLQSVGRFTQEMGRALETVGPVISDGRIDESDAPHLTAAIDEMDKLLGAAQGVRARLVAALPNPTPLP
jgi:hypothetical protein